jgi:alpha-ketoglutarate-dependent 2,4-dichlorophenoxyacetate dioxygenase
MSLSVKPLHPLFVGEVTGLDLRRPAGPDLVAEVNAAIDRHAVLVFRDQFIGDDELLSFSSLLGPLETTAKSTLAMNHRIKDPRLADVSNVDENEQLLSANDRRRMYNLGNQLWHTDASFRAVPAKFSLLHARSIPPVGGETEFADMRAAYDALDDAMKAKLEGLVAEHSIWHSRARLGFTDFSDAERAGLPPVPQLVVRTHPGSGRKTLYLAAHAAHILGWPEAEGRALIDELIDFATQPRFVYSHSWRDGDLVMWDNRCTMHRGRPWDDASYRRDLRRTTVRDIASTLDQAKAA